VRIYVVCYVAKYGGDSGTLMGAGVLCMTRVQVCMM